MNPMRYMSAIRPSTTSHPEKDTAQAGIQDSSDGIAAKALKIEDSGIERTHSTRGEESRSDTLPAFNMSVHQSANMTAMSDEKTPLISHDQELELKAHVHLQSKKPNVLKRAANGVVGTFRVVISAVLAPGYYIVACFYDEDGNFSATMPFYRVGRKLSRREKRKKSKVSVAASTQPKLDEKHPASRTRDSLTPPSVSRPSSSGTDSDTPSRHTRSHSTSSATSTEDETTRPKRSIRIKTITDDALRKRTRQRRDDAKAALTSSSETSEKQPPLTAATIKSPTSPTSAARLTRYPHAPKPPRPLIPRRQPSYTTANAPISGATRKTLVIDLDETLIHSMAKGGRMSTGHMVEVKLQTPMGIGGGMLGPQVPILYYVHKRPHCDEFLRKVSKWYNLIVFTASVQEYADPVIDWLELERKYFTARYYRQHCTYRNGAYIKDLAHVEPDLSRVMILDNSPLSYIFHEDNAIPIEGWISDPTDADLLHLIPLLEGLQYTTDVRALLALRLGESSATVAATSAASGGTTTATSTMSS